MRTPRSIQSCRAVADEIQPGSLIRINESLVRHVDLDTVFCWARNRNVILAQFDFVTHFL